jgi:hypothetical protein
MPVRCNKIIKNWILIKQLFQYLHNVPSKSPNIKNATFLRSILFVAETYCI